MHWQTDQTTTYSTVKKTSTRQSLVITDNDRALVVAILLALLGCAPADSDRTRYHRYHEHTIQCSYWSVLYGLLER